MKHEKFGLFALIGLGAIFGSASWLQTSAESTIINASNYETLQEALDALPASGGIVKLPPGEFELNRPLLLTKENARIEGSGAATRIINRNTEGQPAFVARHEDRTPDSQARLWRIELTGFRISGNPQSGDGLVLEGVNELYLHGVTVDHHGGNGITMSDCYENPRVTESNITYNAEAGLNILGGHDIVVNGNEFEENHNALRCIDSFNLCMVGNNIDDHLAEGVIIENTYGSVISGNMIEECAGWAIVLDRDCYGITLASNVIAHNLSGIDLRDAWGSTVSSNTFTIIPRQALRIGPESGRVTVTGNNFSDSYIGGKTRRQVEPDAEWPRMSEASGIVLEETRDVTITGNVFSGLVNEAVKTQGQCSRVVLVGNVAFDVGKRGLAKGTAYDLQGVEEVRREGNIDVRETR